jgi:hypothetical protein
MGSDPVTGGGGRSRAIGGEVRGTRDEFGR